ncbi:type 4b pilus protein PilO2 [Halodesulfovibrio sp.]|jgi:hypothetical protein|uniref:type 4b pilus protein PilO2 n=1 Tax=Halodesulfovibrio sp. TaxID=1912772 RepID=UPI0025CF12A3|nr:type 4b pilus protein PilO2 [Halodesulfovibrio sp.]MCT4533759.1 type 4b pilus protein PilO2 [Halodesulfovibrio sp.]
MRSIKINGKIYVAGLWWQVLEGTKKKDQLTQIRANVDQFKEDNFNCYVIRNSQFGLGKLDGKIKGYPSLICALLDRSQSTWLGRFLLQDEDGKNVWWVCAVKDGKPLAEGDTVFNTQEEADSHLARLREISDWEHEVTTDSFVDTIAHFTGLLKPAQRIRSLEVKRIPVSVRLLVVALLCTGCYLAYSEYEAHKQAEFNRIQRQLNAEIAQQKRKALEESPEQFFPRVWENTPDVGHVAALCIPKMQSIPLYNNGWSLFMSTCDVTAVPARLNTEWNHTKGARFDALPVIFNDPAQLDAQNPIKAHSTHVLNIRRERASKPLLSKEEAVGRLYQVTAAAQGRISVNWSQVEIHKVSDVIGKPLQFSSPWRQCKWTLSGVPNAAITSQSLLTYLSELSGIVIKKITYLPQGWTITGELYVQN